MQIKLIGIGKCGSRVVYDFYAYVAGIPASYSIKTLAYDKSVKKIILNNEKIKRAYDAWRQLQYRTSSWVHELRNPMKLMSTPELVVMDSDRDNNEIINYIEYLTREQSGPNAIEGLRRLLFPGTTVPFANRKGGCDVHIVSESVADEWPDIPGKVLDASGVDIFVTAFSVGGGTGGGAGPVILQRCKAEAEQERKTSNHASHCMGVAVLPSSDEQYNFASPKRTMDTIEKYNTGRFFIGIYSNRRKERANPRIGDSIWLFSNDCLNINDNVLELENTESSHEDSIDDKNLSIMNFYISANLAMICNASSVATKSHPNFDATEMSNRLNSCPVISGFSFKVPDSARDIHTYFNTVTSLFRDALSNSTVYSDKNDAGKKSLFGLSVPVRYDDSCYAMEFLNCKSADDFSEKMKSYDIDKAPLEFKTTQHVVMIYGQPDKTHSVTKEELASRVCSSFFPKSNMSYYYYQHSGEADMLLVILVNPFLRMIQKAIYFYIAEAFVDKKKLKIDDSAIDRILDEVITAEKFDAYRLSRSLGLTVDTHETITDLVGQETMSFIESNDVKYVTADNVLKAIESLHGIYHRQRTSVERTSKI
jgi:hypothetical protein